MRTIVHLIYFLLESIYDLLFFTLFFSIRLFRWGTARIAANIVFSDDSTVLAVRLLQVAVQAVRVPAPEDTHRGLGADPP